MNRALYVAGGGYVAACALVLALHASGSRGEPVVIHAMTSYSGGGGQWFAQMKPYCNALEVELRQQQNPAPGTVEGAGYSAACYALAGKIERAREVIDRVPTDQRWRAAGIVFDIGHPVADAGDDASAGPIMRLVADYWPNHYMALYHAGVAEYGLGQTDLARTHLRRFLELYSQEDGWRGNARELLRRMGGA
jgi:hypothetical protein